MQSVQQYLPFWEHLSESEQQLLQTTTVRREFCKGAHIHKGEDACLGVLILLKGMMRAYMLSEEGREVTLFRLEQGDVCILSASCVLSRIDFDVFLDAEEAVEVLQIPASAFAQVTKTNIYAECFAYKETADRFSDVMWCMQQLLFSQFDQRLASYLLDEINRGQNATLHTTHEQIAKNIGSAREVVTRTLKKFAKSGILTLSRGEITVVNKAALQQKI